eukprot:EG_transcript_20533
MQMPHKVNAIWDFFGTQPIEFKFNQVLRGSGIPCLTPDVIRTKEGSKIEVNHSNILMQNCQTEAFGPFVTPFGCHFVTVYGHRGDMEVEVEEEVHKEEEDINQSLHLPLCGLVCSPKSAWSHKGRVLRTRGYG